MSVLGQAAVLFRVAVGLDGGRSRPPRVGLIVEFFEEEEEHDRVHPYPPDERPWIVAIDEEQLECVHHDSDELNLETNKRLIERTNLHACFLKQTTCAKDAQRCKFFFTFFSEVCRIFSL